MQLMLNIGIESDLHHFITGKDEKGNEAKDGNGIEAKDGNGNEDDTIQGE